MMRLLASTALAALAIACAGRPPAARPPAAPPPQEPAAPRAPRIAIVDLTRALRAHARWPEVQVLDRQIGDLEVRMSLAAETRPQVVRIDVPKVDLTPEMKAAVERMRPEFQQEAEAVKAAARDQLNAYVAQLRAEQQKRMQAKGAQVEADLTKAAQDKQQALSADTNQFQQQTMEAYRLRLLNLKLKIDNVQPASKADAEKLTQEMQALTKERDDKIAARSAANLQALQDFQKAQVQAANEQMKAFQQQLNTEGQQSVNARVAALTEEMRAQLKAKQADFDQRLRQQQEHIVSSARQQETQQVEKARTQAQTQAAAQSRAENAKLQGLQQQLRALEVSRARLVGVITAEIRVEAAALAQEKGWDSVLTQTLAAPGSVDATDDLIARLKH